MSVTNGFYLYSASSDWFQRARISSKKTSTPIQSYTHGVLCKGSGFDEVDTVDLITANTAGRSPVSVDESAPTFAIDTAIILKDLLGYDDEIFGTILIPGALK
jgi:hypothetical protein